MRQVLLAGAALFALVSPAMAGVITISALDDGVAVALVCTGGINASISCDGASTHFASIDIAAAGNPPLPGASLASLTIDATAATGGTHVLDISVDQTGLNILTGGADATSTFTVNHLVGGPFGPATLSTNVNGALFASNTFPITTNATTSETNPLPALVTSTGHDYSITFTAAGQAAADTIQLVTGAVTVPEPMTLGILGMGLLGLGMVRYRRSN